jgi:DNA-binding Lrp family transcriptional regulator
LELGVELPGAAPALQATPLQRYRNQSLPNIPLPFSLSRFSRAILKPKTQNLNPALTSHLPTFPPFPMDPLLELLHQNSNVPRADLAKLLNLSIEEIDRRIDRYEKERVILGYQAVVDPEKIDADAVTAFIEVSITPERGGGFDRLAERIARFDEVKSCWLMSGGYDLAILVEGGNLREIARFVSEKLSTVEGVISTATRFRLKTYKQNGMLLSQPANAERLPVSP